ncbi:MAG: Rab family GTPase [Candidatus Thorarchaeota archaeon]
MHNIQDVKVKICMTGDISVGKTSLVRRYVMDIFDDTYIATLGTKISKKKVRLFKNNQTYHLTLSLWDVLGHDVFENMYSWAFEGAKAAMLVCDLTREDTLKNVTNWITRVKNVAGDIPFIILANKKDLKKDYEFDEDDLIAFSSELELQSYMTSAKSGENVSPTFVRIGDMVLDNILTKGSKSFSFNSKETKKND